MIPVSPDWVRYVIALIAAALAVGVVLWVFVPFPPRAPTGSVTLEEVLADIRTELQKLQAAPGGEALGLRLGEVQVTLAVEGERSQAANAKLSVPVFKESAIGARQASGVTASSQITLSLRPPPELGTLSADEPSRIRFADLLIAARDALIEARKEENPLDPRALEVELRFVLVASGTAEAGFKTEVISAGSEAKWSEKSTNAVKLKYALAEAAAAAEGPPPP